MGFFLGPSGSDPEIERRTLSCLLEFLDLIFRYPPNSPTRRERLATRISGRETVHLRHQSGDIFGYDQISLAGHMTPSFAISCQVPPPRKGSCTRPFPFLRFEALMVAPTARVTTPYAFFAPLPIHSSPCVLDFSCMLDHNQIATDPILQCGQTILSLVSYLT